MSMTNGRITVPPFTQQTDHHSAGAWMQAHVLDSAQETQFLDSQNGSNPTVNSKASAILDDWGATEIAISPVNSDVEVGRRTETIQNVDRKTVKESPDQRHQHRLQRRGDPTSTPLPAFPAGAKALIHGRRMLESAQSRKGNRCTGIGARRSCVAAWLTVNKLRSMHLFHACCPSRHFGGRLGAGIWTISDTRAARGGLVSYRGKRCMQCCRI